MTSGNWVLTKALEGPGGAISELTNTASELVPKLLPSLPLAGR